VAQGELGKPRPALVVQSDELGDDTTSVVLCPMSSDIKQISRMRPVIDPADGKGLVLRSQVMTDKVVALGRKRIRRVVGRISSEELAHVDQALLLVLGLTPR
jgi:mRNA interferase MazF